ncbi:type II toxin-antitoxin system PemK/MazF family toxin, partial [[Clostridium] innocuum]|nr:type II toxin-antitoxin system PemK/MazF family toxin [[Clostridium] innocuum]
NVGNCFSPTIIIAAITSVSKKSRKFPTHYHLNDRCGLVKPSVVMLEQIRTIDKSRLKNYIGHLNKDDMENINKTLLCSLGIT